MLISLAQELRAAAGLSADANDIIDAGDKEGFKIILMSATINADKFSDYFGGCPTLNVPGRTFPVTPFFLEHILERTGHEIVEGSDYAKKKSALGGSRRNHPAPATSTRLGGNGGPNSQEATPAAAPPTRKELEIMYPDLSAATIQSLSIVDEEVINYDLLESLLEYIHEVSIAFSFLTRPLRQLSNITNACGVHFPSSGRTNGRRACVHAWHDGNHEVI